MRYVFCFLLLISGQALASPAEERDDHQIPILETAQSLFGSNANVVANQLDAFFATERADDELGRSRIRLRSNFSVREGSKSTLKNQYRINLKLPHLEQKFKVTYFEESGKKRKKRKAKEDAAAAESISQSVNKLDTRWLFNADAGVSAAIPPKIVTRSRLRKSWETGPFINRFVEQLTYTTDASGLVEETTLFTDHSFSDDLLFRFVNTKVWKVLKKKFATNHGPTVLHRVSDHDAFAYNLFLSTIINNGVSYVNNYQVSIDYRRNLYKNWLYLDIIPGLDFPKTLAWKRNPFIIAQLELLFGETR